MKVLVAISDPEREGSLLETAAALAGDGEVVLASAIEVTGDATLASAQPEARARRRALDAMAGDLPGRHLRSLVTVARVGWDAIREACATERPDLLLVAWRRPGWDLLGTTIEAVLRQPPCDLAVVKGRPARSKRILVPVRGGRYAQLAARLGIALAKAHSGSVTLLHVAERDGGRKTQTLYQLLGERAYDERVERLVTRSGDPSKVIGDELAEHDAIVFGATGREGARDPLGPVGQKIISDARNALVVRTSAPLASPMFVERTRLPPERAERSRVLGEIVDKWFAENTFSSAEFADLRRLVDAKERQNLRVSVGLPTLNEEVTIRKVIRAIRSRLVERFPLVDELVVIDSRSEDRTRQIAEDEGVPVFIHDEILPETGSYRGKGEALWKSLHVLTGDIVVWIDTDVTSAHPKFVYGIVGPLLMRPDLQFVKAFYQRPLHIGDELQATGGGRVTELAARPILNLFFPELSGIVQPLSGEQAGRRSLLEQLPFFTGYGVETGLLVDTLQRAGLGAIGQVDMKQRIHRNQSLYNLSKMSFEVLQVAIKRVGEAHGTNLLEEANFTMKLIAASGGKLHLEMHDILDVERPPMATIASYQAKRNAAVDTAAN
ncbi:MAG TPA: glucosyl-3-phosphoglycerate synthase [Candidatus Polarisedimenticolia bacterium]|jgi:glucosyl-3-phosphoglycerate synthase|nr:glucosyl-3-phosphoglycerate synthase [Candidatus Polarisedimenticolia bacterium]